MINPIELRIGNYVMDFYKSIHGIQVIERKFLISKPGIAERYEDINPILLTEKWLLKLGFRKDKDGDYKLFPSFGVQFIAGFYENELWFNVYTRSVHSDYLQLHLEKEIKYVHSLQNLHYCLTGEELTAADFSEPKP